MTLRRAAWLAPLSTLLACSAAAGEATVHTIFSTECNRYFDWCGWSRLRAVASRLR